MKISLIIPCYRSAETVESVVLEIQKTMKIREVEYEIIAVNDCSPDNVFEVLTKIANEDKKVKVVDLARNAGKHAAVMAGLAYTTGDFVCLLDDDGQCPMNEFWRLFEPIENGFDVSIARYGKKKESAFRLFGSRVNDKMSQVFIEKPKDLKLSNFIIMKQFVAVQIMEYKNPYPYLDGLILNATSKIVNVDMEDREREIGGSTYTLRKLIGQISNGFTSFSVIPLRMATFLGCGISVLGFVYLLIVVIRKFLNPNIIAGYSSLMATNLFIGGILMILLGIIGEYVGRMYICINNKPQYVIRETLNIDDSVEKSDTDMKSEK